MLQEEFCNFVGKFVTKNLNLFFVQQPSSIKTDVYGGGEEEDNWENSTLTSLDNQTSITPPLSLRSPRSDEVCWEIFSWKISIFCKN